MLFFLLFPFILTPAAPYSDDYLSRVTDTLNSLLVNNSYDKRIRPGFGGPPAQVGVNLHIKSLGPVSENEEMYYMDVYFRQTWFDKRLSFSLPGIEEFSMSWLFLEKVWKPDTYFMNGKKSYLHRITSPNKFLRVRRDGFLTYSMRLTISASCRMHLRKFPLDSQKCPLLIGSYGYTSQDVVYTWTGSGVGLEPGLEMAQYDLVNFSTEGKPMFKRGNDEYSVIQAIFHLRRSTGYFLLQIYVPCSLIVCSSWVSFWINPTDVAGRVSLAVTTVLSITTMGFGGRAQLPKVPYATALDWFIIFCFSFAFAVMVEYAIINRIDKLTMDIRRLLEDRAKKKKLEEEAKEQEPVQGPSIVIEEDKEVEGEAFQGPINIKDIEEGQWTEEDEEFRRKQLSQPRRWLSVPSLFSADNKSEGPLKKQGEMSTSDSSVNSSKIYELSCSLKERFMIPLKIWQSIRWLPREEDIDLQEVPINKFNRIDIFARKLFPVSFGLFLCTYGIMYTFYIPDIVFV